MSVASGCHCWSLVLFRDGGSCQWWLLVVIKLDKGGGGQWLSVVVAGGGQWMSPVVASNGHGWGGSVVGLVVWSFIEDVG